MQLKDPAVFVHEASELWQLWVPLAHSSISTKKEPCRCNHNLYNCFFFLQRGNKLNRINYFMLNERKKLSQVWIDIVVLTGHNDLAHLAYLAPVVQKMDNCIHSTNLYPVDSAIDYLILTYWIVIYPSDSASQRLRNGCLYFIFIYCSHNLTAWHRSSVRLLQAAITVIFSHINENFIGRARRVQIKSVVLLLLPAYSENKHIKQTF